MMAAVAQSSNEEKRRKDGKPQPDIETVRLIASSSWSLQISETDILQLESYDDANFYLRASKIKDLAENPEKTEESEFLIKFYNAVESDNSEMLKGISLLLNTVSSYSGDSLSCDFVHPTVPRPILIETILSADCTSNVDVNDVAFSMISSASNHTSKQYTAARLFHWVPGTILNKAGTLTTSKLIVNLGYSLGSITNSLRGFDHPSFHREHAWDLQNFPSTYATFSTYIDEQDIKEFVDEVFKRFNEIIIPISDKLERSIIMGDCNDANVILNHEMTAVTGIIDFGDAVYTWSVNEIAIAMAYALLTTYGKQEPLKCVACLFGGYTYATQQFRIMGGNIPINNEKSEELESLHTLICMRLCVSIMIGAYSISMDPSNEYLKLHSNPAKETLRALMS